MVLVLRAQRRSRRSAGRLWPELTRRSVAVLRTGQQARSGRPTRGQPRAVLQPEPHAAASAAEPHEVARTVSPGVRAGATSASGGPVRLARLVLFDPSSVVVAVGTRPHRGRPRGASVGPLRRDRPVRRSGAPRYRVNARSCRRQGQGAPRTQSPPPTKVASAPRYATTEAPTRQCDPPWSPSSKAHLIDAAP